MRISDWSSDVCSSDLREAISALRLFASSAPLMIVTPWDDSCGDCSQASADRAGLGYAPRMNRLMPLIFALAGLVLALSPAVARAQANADTTPAIGRSARRERG